MKKILAIIFIVFLYNSNVYAASICNYKEQTIINQKASNIKANYEIITETVKFEDMNSTMEVFEISIYNITEDFYVIVRNSINEEEKVFTFEDTTDGIAKFKWAYAENVTNFTIQAYTTNKTNCPDENYKTVYITTPRYNSYYDIESCQDNLDFYLCQKFVNYQEVDEEKFFKQLENYKNGNISNNDDEQNDPIQDKLSDKIFSFLNDNKWYVLGGIIITIAIIVIIQKFRTKKQRDFGL